MEVPEYVFTRTNNLENSPNESKTFVIDFKNGDPVAIDGNQMDPVSLIKQANSLAEAAGGHLAVPSSQEEADWISTSMRELLDQGRGCWIGGRQKGTATPVWTFVTGERFDFVTWAPEQPDLGSGPKKYLQFGKGEDSGFGYLNAAGDPSEARFFLVEWSAPSRRNMPGAGEANRPAGACLLYTSPSPRDS